MNLARTIAALAAFSVFSGHCASLDFEQTASDWIVVGATSEKITVAVTGYKNVPSSSPSGSVLASGLITTSSSLGAVALTMAPEHKPYGRTTPGYLEGLITNGETQTAKINLRAPTTIPIVWDAENTPWVVAAQGVSSMTFVIYQSDPGIAVGVYPITIRGALYQP